MSSPTIERVQIAETQCCSSADHTPARREPPRYKLAVVSWLALYPTLNVLFLSLEPLGVSALPLLARTLIVSVILVPTMVYLLIPAVQRILAPWLRS